MDVNEPGLFNLPDLEPRGGPARAHRGRNRETWARTATAEVSIIDAEALHAAAARLEENVVTIGLRADSDAEGKQPNGPESGLANEAFDALGCLLWPTDGLEGPLEASAFRILSVDGGQRSHGRVR